MFGGAGDDVLIGSDFGDSLFGDTGADRMEGGAGSDHYVFVEANDLIIDTGGDHDLIWYNGSSYSVPMGIEELRVMNSVDGAIFTGNDEANQIVIEDDVDTTISGMGGDDDLSGGGGFSVIFGGSGNDTLSGGGAVLLFGEAGDDLLFLSRDGDEGLGGDGDDFYSSLYGACIIHGDRGADSMVTSAGDIIWYMSHEDSNAVDGIDTIELYEHGVTLEFGMMDGDLDTEGQQALVYVGNDATPGVGELYDLTDSAGNLIGYAANLDSDAEIEFQVMLISYEFYAGPVLAEQWDHQLILG